MKTLLFAPASGFDHHVPPGHPERPERLAAVLRGLERVEGLHRREAPPAGAEAARLVHDEAYVARIESLDPGADGLMLDADTAVSAGTLAAVHDALGAGIAAVDAVLDGEAEAAFIAARPPGHHAERDRAMGFCVYNTVAVAALHALERRGLSKAAVIDIDVHHGNGTQDAARDEPRLAFASIHQEWIYPGTGAAHERGPHGNIANAPVPGATTGPAWREAVERILLPHLEAQQPEILLVSAGFDAHRADPLAGLALEAEDFAWAGERLARFARDHARGRLVCVLEGGYDCDALEASAEAFVRALGAA